MRHHAYCKGKVKVRYSYH